MLLTDRLRSGYENDEKVRNITQLSDHYGISCAIRYVNAITGEHAAVICAHERINDTSGIHE
jgi:hypothetical protein